MKTLKIILITTLSITLASCITIMPKKTKEQMSKEIMTLEESNRNLNNKLSGKENTLQQTATNLQLFRDIYNLNILLSDIKKKPTQRKFDEAKQQIAKINAYSKESKNVLTEEEWQFYVRITEDYNTELGKFYSR